MLRIIALLLCVFASPVAAQTYPSQISSVNPASLITINSPASATALRANLIGQIFGPSGMNSALTPAYYSTFAFAGTTWASTPNIASIQEWRVTLSKGIVSRLYKFSPTVFRNPSSGKAGFIISAGHGQIGTMDPFTQLIKWLVASGYEVWTVDMPLSGLNANPQAVAGPYGGTVMLTSHDTMVALQTDAFNPLRIFMEGPLAIVNNMAARGITNIGMAGLSGGGWTTDMYSALDERVEAGYSVAGTMPIYARSWAPPHSSLGDWEQMAVANLGIDYLDIYVLGTTSGRRRMSIHNYADDCCFGGTVVNHYGPAVSSVATSIGGSYATAIDYTATSHTISAWAANVIEMDVSSRF